MTIKPDTCKEPGCGATVPPGAVFCDLCGTKKQLRAMTERNARLEEDTKRLIQEVAELAVENEQLQLQIKRREEANGERKLKYGRFGK